jgi:hypothetical protein
MRNVVATLLLAGGALAGCNAPVASGPVTPACTKLEGSVTVTNSVDWKDLLDSGCTEITGSLRITAPGLSTLQGASPLRKIGAGLMVSGNTDLTSISFPALLSVGSVSIANNSALLSFDLPALIRAGSLSISNNAALTDFSLPVLATVDGAVSVVDNPSLSWCLAWDLKRSLESHGATGPFTIAGNDPTRSCSSCIDTQLAIAWELRDSAGNFNVSCGSVTTFFVDIYVATLPPVRAPCASHVATVDTSGLAPGSYVATVEGIDADGATIWSRDQFSVTVGSCNPSYTARPGEGTLELAYAYPNGVGCSSGYMWYSLFDEVAGQTISAIYAGSLAIFKTFYACGDSVQVAVPFGTYTLDWMQEVQNPTTVPTPVMQACGPVRAAVSAPGVTSMPVGMTAYVAACP